MNEMTHERCSELLADHVHGRLGAEDSRAVSAHLETCEACATERRALVALAGPGPEPLTEIERARMRRVVLDEAVPMPEATSVVVPGPDRRARLLPLLGAAAVVVIAAVFAFSGLGNLGGSDDGVGGIDSAEDSTGGDQDDGDAGAAQEEAFESGAEALDAADAGGTSTRSKAPPAPQFEASLGDLDPKRLNNLGRHGLPLIVFSRSYTTSDVTGVRDDLIEQLAGQAPDARADQIRECSATITSEFPTALPVYAAVGTFADGPDREVLVLAFVWTDETDGPLDQSMVWAWPLGTCDSIAHYSKNVIEPKR